ncbi:hypothetical protein CIHG_06887, partial [Coccidioides immitis H538.4]
MWLEAPGEMKMLVAYSSGSKYVSRPWITTLRWDREKLWYGMEVQSPSGHGLPGANHACPVEKKGGAIADGWAWRRLQNREEMLSACGQ